MGDRRERRRIEREANGGKMPRRTRAVTIIDYRDEATAAPAWIVPAAFVVSLLLLGALTVGAVVEGG